MTIKVILILILILIHISKVSAISERQRYRFHSSEQSSLPIGRSDVVRMLPAHELKDESTVLVIASGSGRKLFVC